MIYKIYAVVKLFKAANNCVTRNKQFLLRIKIYQNEDVTLNGSMIFSYQFKELQASSLSLSKDGRLNFSLNIRKKVETCDIKHLDIF